MKKIKGTYLLLVAVLAVAAILAGCSADGELGPGPDGGPAAVALGTAGGFAILAETGVSNVPTSAVTGNIGVSAIAATGITGFVLTLDGSGQWSTAPEVAGKLYAADYAVPTPANMTAAIADMQTAYTDAAGRVDPAPVTELGAGNISGLTIEPGIYKWGTGVLIASDVTLWGSATATWIFQIAQTLTVENGVHVVLAGGALPENIVWQVGTGASLGTTAHVEGTIMTGTAITLATGASLNGRALAQTAVTLDHSTIVEP